MTGKQRVIMERTLDLCMEIYGGAFDHAEASVLVDRFSTGFPIVVWLDVDGVSLRQRFVSLRQLEETAKRACPRNC